MPISPRGRNPVYCSSSATLDVTIACLPTRSPAASARSSATRQGQSNLGVWPLWRGAAPAWTVSKRVSRARGVRWPRLWVLRFVKNARGDGVALEPASSLHFESEAELIALSEVAARGARPRIAIRVTRVDARPPPNRHRQSRNKSSCRSRRPFPLRAGEPARASRRRVHMHIVVRSRLAPFKNASRFARTGRACASGLGHRVRISRRTRIPIARLDPAAARRKDYARLFAEQSAARRAGCCSNGRIRGIPGSVSACLR